MEKLKVTDLALWESFLCVNKTGSFTAAASKLRVGVPVLSKRIASLENSLGVRLFARTTRKVTPTHEAKEMLSRVETLLEEAREIETRAIPNAEPKGLIRLSTFPAFAQSFLADALIEFQNTYPEIRFDLQVSDKIIDLVESEIDLAIRVQQPTGAQFVFRKLLENRLVLCATPAYLKSLKREIRKVEDLDGLPLLMPELYQNIG